jgi:hypothetical protein
LSIRKRAILSQMMKYALKLAILMCFTLVKVNTYAKGKRRKKWQTKKHTVQKNIK